MSNFSITVPVFECCHPWNPEITLIFNDQPEKTIHGSNLSLVAHAADTLMVFQSNEIMKSIESFFPQCVMGAFYFLQTVVIIFQPVVELSKGKLKDITFLTSMLTFKPVDETLQVFH